jgi:predicted nuclease of restriction endonuclease-like (RecB) superfamily
VSEIATTGEPDAPYQTVFGDVSRIIDAARESAARSVNAAMTAAYWLTGRRIVEFEQSGEERAEYGAALMERLAGDLTGRFGRGFSRQNVQNMRLFYLSYPPERIRQTLSGNLGRSPQLPIRQTPSGESEIAPAGEDLGDLLTAFPLPWSAYVRLLSVRNPNAREFYETEAQRGGWSVRQLDRQINSQFYERTALSKNRAAMLSNGREERPEDVVLPGQQIKDPFVLEFLDLKDEYSESDLEEALIQHLEAFLLELGDDFCFVGRQRRLRVGGQWYRVDLLFFHRRLQCLVVIDLKIGAFTHADAGQMHFYLNYAREHWAREGENPPVGLILCSEKDEALARYALEGLSNNVMAAEYRITLPDEEILAAELDRTRQEIELRASLTLPAATVSATLSVRQPEEMNGEST